MPNALFDLIAAQPTLWANAVGFLGMLCSLSSLAAKNERNLQLLNILASVFFALAQVLLNSYTSAAVSALLALGSVCWWFPGQRWAPYVLLGVIFSLSTLTAWSNWPGLSRWLIPTLAGMSTLWGYALARGLSQRWVIGLANTLWLISSLQIGLYTQTATCLVAYGALIVGFNRTQKAKQAKLAALEMSKI